MIRSTLRFAFATSLLAAACGTDKPPVDDPGPDAAVVPAGRSVIETCIAGGGAMAQAWSTGNLHGAVTSIAVTGTTVVLGSQDGSVKQWAVGGSPSYGTPFDDGDSHGPVVGSLAFTTDETVLGADAAGRLSEWNLVDAKPMHTTQVTTVPLAAVAVSEDGAHVAAGGGTDLRVIDRGTGVASAKLPTALWTIDAVAFGHGGAFLSAGDWYGTPMIERRDAASPADALDTWNDQTMTGHVRAVAIDHDGTKVLAGGDGFVAVFDAAHLAAGPLVITKVPGHMVVGLVALSGGELFATAGAEGTVQLWKVATGEHVSTTQVARPIGLGVDAAGAQLFTAGPDSMLRAVGCR